METKHTPGPWITETSGSVIWIGPKRHRTDGKVEDIVTHIEIDKDYKTGIKIKMEADAKLIAAAPELLEACIIAKEMMLKSGITYDNADQYNLLSAAIKKATV